MRLFPILKTLVGFVLIDRRGAAVAFTDDAAIARLLSLAPALLESTEAAIPLFYRDWLNAEQACALAEHIGGVSAWREARLIAEKKKQVYIDALAATVLIAAK